jgi:hypothetical protein
MLENSTHASKGYSPYFIQLELAHYQLWFILKRFRQMCGLDTLTSRSAISHILLRTFAINPGFYPRYNQRLKAPPFWNVSPACLINNFCMMYSFCCPDLSLKHCGGNQIYPRALRFCARKIEPYSCQLRIVHLGEGFG